MKNDFNIDFMLISSGRSGSSWLYQCLKEHPQMCLDTRPKEMPLIWEGREDAEYYFKNLFKGCVQNQKRGWWARYLQYAEETAPRIKQSFPNTKFVVCLRNPIERIYSHYLLKKNEGGINCPFEDFIKEGDLIKAGFYYSQLLTFLKFFPKEQILILIYEDIEKNPLGFIQKIYKFLGVDSNFIPPSINRKVFPTTKNLLFMPFFSKANLEKTATFLRNRRANILIKFLRTAKISSFVYFLLRRNIRDYSTAVPSPKPAMNLETRQYLRGVYREEIKNLEKLINRNLNFWQ